MNNTRTCWSELHGYLGYPILEPDARPGSYYMPGDVIVALIESDLLTWTATKTLQLDIAIGLEVVT